MIIKIEREGAPTLEILTGPNESMELSMVANVLELRAGPIGRVPMAPEDDLVHFKIDENETVTLRTPKRDIHVGEPVFTNDITLDPGAEPELPCDRPTLWYRIDKDDNVVLAAGQVLPPKMNFEFEGFYKITEDYWVCNKDENGGYFWRAGGFPPVPRDENPWYNILTGDVGTIPQCAAVVSRWIPYRYAAVDPSHAIVAPDIDSFSYRDESGS